MEGNAPKQARSFAFTRSVRFFQGDHVSGHNGFCSLIKLREFAKLATFGSALIFIWKLLRIRREKFWHCK